MAKNIEKYIRLASYDNSPCGNGWTYKNDEAFISKSDEICYIGEADLSDLEEMLENGEDLTDEELLEKGYAESYNSIVKQIVDAKFNGYYADAIAEHIYKNADWACISTYILEFEEYYEQI